MELKIKNDNGFMYNVIEASDDWKYHLLKNEKTGQYAVAYGIKLNKETGKYSWDNAWYFGTGLIQLDRASEFMVGKISGIEKTKKVAMVAGKSVTGISEREFKTEAEVEAYALGAEDVYGYDEYLITEANDFDDIFDTLNTIMDEDDERMADYYDYYKKRQPGLKFAELSVADKGEEEGFYIFNGALFDTGKYVTSNYVTNEVEVIYLEPKDKELDEKQKDFLLSGKLFCYDWRSEGFISAFGGCGMFYEEECLIFQHGKMAKSVPNVELRKAMGDTYSMSEMDFKVRYYEMAKKHAPELF